MFSVISNNCNQIVYTILILLVFIYGNHSSSDGKNFSQWYLSSIMISIYASLNFRANEINECLHSKCKCKSLFFKVYIADMLNCGLEFSSKNTSEWRVFFFVNIFYRWDVYRDFSALSSSNIFLCFTHFRCASLKGKILQLISYIDSWCIG